VFAAVCELAAVWHPAQECPVGDGAWCVQGQSAPARALRLRRAAGADLRKWSGKTLADHRGDRKAWIVETLGLEPPDPARYTWHVVTPDDHDYLPLDRRLLHVVADRARWRAALAEAKQRAWETTAEFSATGSAA
jgi:hypothetical protein